MRFSNITKAVGGGIVGGMTMDSWLREKGFYGTNKSLTKQDVIDAINHQMSQNDAARAEIVRQNEMFKQYVLESNEKLQTLNNYQSGLGKIANEIIDLKSKLTMDPKSPQGSELEAQINLKIEELQKHISSKPEVVTEMQSSIKNIILNNQLSNNSSTDIVNSTNNTANTPSNNNLIEGINPEGPQEMGIFSPIQEFLTAYKEFLSTLNSEQLGCLTNAIGFVSIFFLLTSIGTVLFADSLISSLKLEQKYPKLANFLNYRKTINKYSLIFNFVLIYIILIIYIFVNILVLIY